MPVITFEMTPMTKEQKQQIAREFTDTVVRTTGVPEKSVYVLFHENTAEHIAVGDTLLCDTQWYKIQQKEG